MALAISHVMGALARDIGSAPGLQAQFEVENHPPHAAAVGALSHPPK